MNTGVNHRLGFLTIQADKTPISAPYQPRFWGLNHRDYGSYGQI